jgi:hypothetical protein
MANTIVEVPPFRDVLGAVFFQFDFQGAGDLRALNRIGSVEMHT